MDPKQSAQLDPKLQEAYDRVMGLTLEQPAPQPSPQPPVTAVEPTQITPSPPVASTPTLNQPVTVTSTALPTTISPETDTAPVPSQLPQMSASALDAMSPTPTTPVHKKMHAFIAKKTADFKVSPVILIVGAIAFLLIYTVIWVKVFNLSVPLINP